MTSHSFVFTKTFDHGTAASLFVIAHKQRRGHRMRTTPFPATASRHRPDRGSTRPLYASRRATSTMQRRTPFPSAVAPPMPPWIHSSPSRSSLAGLEIGLPPSPAPSGRDMFIDRAPSGLDKALPPIPTRQDKATRRPSKQFLSIPETRAPLIPHKNPRRFSWVSSDVSPTSVSPLRPLRRTSSSNYSPISNPSASTSIFPAALLPYSASRKTSSTPQPLKLKHPAPLSTRTSKVAQLTGCDLSSDLSPSHSQRSRFESDASISSSLYSDPELSPTTLKGRERQYSEDSLSSIVDSYSDWGSWAPSSEDFSSPLSSPPYPPSPKINMDAVVPEDVSSTSTLTSRSNNRTPVPPALPSPRNRSRQLGPPSEAVPWRASYLNPPTLENLIEQERTHLENGYIGEPPLSPLAQIAALQLKRDSGFGNSGEERFGRSTVRPQASLPTIPSSYYQNHEYASSVSRFSDGSSDEEDDSRSIRSMTSGRLRNSARGVRDSFVRGLSGLSRPTSGALSRFSQPSDIATSSQRTSDTSATAVGPEEAHKGHKHTLSTSTTYSTAMSVGHSTLDPSTESLRPNKHDSGFSRSWTAATQIFKKPLRSSYSTPRSEGGPERGDSSRNNRMTTVPAKFYGESITQDPPGRPKVTALVGKMPAPRGTVDLSEARRNKVVMLPEEIVAASRLASEYASREDKVESGDEALSPVEQATAALNGRRFSITRRAGKVLGTKDTTKLPPPLSNQHGDNLEVPLAHVQSREEDEAAKGAEDSAKRGSFGRGFSVMAMMGRELDSFKAKAGIRSREERRREQLKGLIRVLEVDEKEAARSKKAAVPGKAVKKEVREVEVQTQDNGNGQIQLGLHDDELSTTAQIWL